MKAWLAKDTNECRATVVFAETRGKARALAMCTDACEDVDFVDIEVCRKPQMDKYYTEGKMEMDWNNSKDRIALVKDCDFVCDYEYWEREDCDTCPAKEYCDRYQECLEEERNGTIY
jgi:hypothetical protein